MPFSWLLFFQNAISSCANVHSITRKTSDADLQSKKLAISFVLRVEIRNFANRNEKTENYD